MMRKIYLASDSKARKKLLNIFGLKFRVLPSKIKEEKRIVGLSFDKLAKINALNKAKECASKIKDGIIIAADTIVVQDDKIYGKPSGMKHAHSMLKKLSSKPQLLYTAVAVIDKQNKKSRTLLECEKTKIFMDKLNDKQINAYFKQTFPLDKAGAFDIQGRGALFIRRIEGCFYNVVGLPINRLSKMLSKLGVKVFMSIFCLLTSLFVIGCTTEYNLVTKQEESYFYSTDKEVQIGQSVARQIEKEYKVVEDPLMQERVEAIGRKIVSVCDRKDIKYHFIVLDMDEVNAVSLPGGYVYIFKGLIEKVDSDDEIAGVVAHEVAHIVARHSIKKLQAQQGYTLLRVLIATTPQGGEVGSAADEAYAQIMLGYSREDELLADQLAARYEKLAGYDPQGMVKFLTKLQEIGKRRPPQEYSYYRTHPYVPDRIRIIKQELGQGMSFDDYINIEQKAHGR